MSPLGTSTPPRAPRSSPSRSSEKRDHFSGSTVILITALGGWPALMGASSPTLLPIANVTAQGDDPLSILNSWIAARNAGDLDRAVAMVTADFARTIGVGLSFSGPAGERSFLETVASSGTRMQVQ